MVNLGNATVVVTGGAGMLGSHTVERLAPEAKKVLVYDKNIKGRILDIAKSHSNVELFSGDLLDRPNLETVISRADLVVHGGAILTTQVRDDPLQALKINIDGAFNVMDICSKVGVSKVVFTSSVSVYGNPAIEGEIDEETPYDPYTVYGMTKVAGEQICRLFHNTRGLNYVALRISSFYGPGQHMYGLFAGLFLKNICNILNGRSPVIYGMGTDCQDIVYVEDVALANLLALKSPVNCECVNIAAGQSYSMREITGLLMDICNRLDLEISYLPVDQIRSFGTRIFSTKKAEKAIGFKAGTTLRTGLTRLIDWVKENNLQSA